MFCWNTAVIAELRQPLWGPEDADQPSGPAESCRDPAPTAVGPTPGTDVHQPPNMISVKEK